MHEKIMAAVCYLFWVPALYWVLTEKKKEGFLMYHATQAFYLWGCFFLLFFGSRLLVNLVWHVFYFPWLDLLEILVVWGMGGYAVYCSYRSLNGQTFTIPH